MASTDCIALDQHGNDRDGLCHSVTPLSRSSRRSNPPRVGSFTTVLAPLNFGMAESDQGKQKMQRWTAGRLGEEEPLRQTQRLRVGWVVIQGRIALTGQIGKGACFAPDHGQNNLLRHHGKPPQLLWIALFFGSPFVKWVRMPCHADTFKASVDRVPRILLTSYERNTYEHESKSKYLHPIYFTLWNEKLANLVPDKTKV